MALLLKNFYVTDGSRDRASRCDLRIEKGLIDEIAPAGTLTAIDGDETWDGQDRHAVIPGLVNAHCHAAMTLLRGLGEEEPLMEWLEQKIWPVEAHLKEDHVYAGSAQAILEMVSGGVTCFADMYYFMESVARCVNELQIRCALAVGVVGRNPELLHQSLNKDFSPLQGPLIRLSLDPHAHYTVSKEGMTEIARVAHERGLALQTHFLEAPWERGYLADTYGLTPLEYLEETGMLSLTHLVLAHGVYLEPDEMTELAGRGNVTVIHCPSSNLKLGSGVAKLSTMYDLGLPVALGTDGAASNNRLDIWQEMRTAALLHKGVQLDPTIVSARQILHSATEAGASAFGFEKVGRIEKGWAADLTFADLSQPHYLGADEENLNGYLVYAGSSADVTDVLCNGRWLVRHRSFLPAMREKLIDQAALQRRNLIALAAQSKKS